jgi:hypothetical protein
MMLPEDPGDNPPTDWVVARLSPALVFLNGLLVNIMLGIKKNETGYYLLG